MRRPFTCLLVSCCLLLSLLQRAAAQDNIIMQGFYWNTIPGDVTNVTTGGIWWDTIATVAPLLKNSGFNVLWTPPAQKGFAGIYDMGYGIADYYDYGQFNQHGTIRTRHGNLTQLQNAITTLKNNNLKVMADVVLNHRAGAFDQQLEECDVPNDGRGRELRYTKFNNASGRMNWDSSFFHPNNHHCDLNPEYHNRSFFEDICYFNRINSILDPTKPNNGWYFAQHNLGVAGDSLVIVGRHMIDTMGFDMVRLDAVKHIEPGFLAPFLVELKNGTQPFAVGESYEGNATLLRNYQQEVANFNTSFGAGGKNAQMGIFDFALRFGLQSMAHDGTGAYDMQNLNSLGLVLMPGGLNANNVVTFVENHDFDRGGYRVVTCPGGPGTLQIGNTCLEYFFQSDHAPILRDKHMLYAYILGAEGHPTVFWKDFFWYDLDDEITWLIALRKQFAKGTTTPMSFLGASGGSFSLNDYFIFRRNGTTGGVSDGAMIGLNDNPSSNQETFVTTAFSNRYLKDYSDGFMFVTRQAANDGRASLPTAPRDYSWWAPTGLYPKPDGVAPSYFNMNASTGGCPHFVALKVSDAANFIVNGAPIAAGDEVAIKNTSGQVVGIGRIGQGFKWNGTHDMLIEVLGSPSTNGMANGETFRLFVYDASANMEVEVAVVQFSPISTAFTFSPDRPNTANRNGNFSTFAVSTSATNAFSCSAISRITAFNTVNVQTQQVCGADVASNAPYDNGWQSTDNGGTNLGAWTLSTSNGNSSQAGFFIGSSNINTGGESFGMYANSAQEANAVRPFLNALIPGTVFSLQMDNGSIQGGGAVGFSLRNASNQNVVEFYFEGGEDDYERNDAGGEQGTGVNFTNTGLNIQFTLLTASTYQLSISRLDGGGNQVINGTLMNPAGGQAITQFRLFNFNAGSVGAADAFFNSFSVCYPPTLIINEVDYDQGSTDDAEFIELRNVSNTAINLDNYTLELVDGTGSIYQTVDLPNVNLSPGNYYVICANATNTPNCDLDITPDIDLIQDGAPDGIRIRLGSLTVDALSYEGTTPGAIEGTTAPTDNGTAARVGLSRIPDGNDTNNNASDFQLACITSGSANANTTACPTINFSLATSSVDEPTTGTTTLLISVALTNYLGSPITLNISAVGSGANPAESPQDYILNTTSLVFNQSGIQFITVAIQREFMDEDADEFFTLNLTIPSANASLGTPSSHVVTIVDNAAVLPIELLDFTATLVSESVLLKWSTATEKNNAFFSVQRSRDGLNWVEIGQVKGKGNSSVLQQYAFTDKQPQTGLNYYRLQQFDFDRQSSFSPVQVVEIKDDKMVATLFPNPANGRIHLQLSGITMQMYNLKIFNVLGQEILEINDSFRADEPYEIPLTFWNSGTYFLRISDENGKIMQVLTFQKK